MTETPLFFERDDARLFGFLHTPSSSRGRIGFVMSHPFGEEKLWSHRVFVTCARALASKGYPVLRFDFTGAGDSSGETSLTTLETHLRDLGAAADLLATRQPGVQRIGLIGLRLGASFAALFAERCDAKAVRDKVRGAPLILWDPVLDGAQYFQEILRSNLSTQLAVYGKVLESREVLQGKILAGDTVNVDGYELGKGLFESCAVPNLLDDVARAHAGPVLVMQVAAGDQIKDRTDLQSLARSYDAGTFMRSNEQPFWREIKPFYRCAENLQAATLNWLEQCDA